MNNNYDTLQQFKINDNKIKYYEEVAHERNEKLKKIKEDSEYVVKLSTDMHKLTVSQDTKINRIHDNVDDVVYNSKQTLNSLIKTAADDKKFKETKCCVLVLLSFALIFLVMLFMNMRS